MVALDKLMEKKNLAAQIDLRIAHLNALRDQSIMEQSHKHKNDIKERIHGRILELTLLRKYPHSGKIKEASNSIWKSNHNH